MGILDMVTADLQQLDGIVNGETLLYAGVTISSDYARTGTYSFKMDDGHVLTLNLSGTNTYYVRFAYLGNTAVNQVYIGQPGQSYYVAHATIWFNPNSISAYRGNSASLWETQPVTVNDGWNLVELYFTIDDTDGVLQIKHNDVLTIDQSGIDMRDSYDTSDHLSFKSGMDSWYIDDFMVRDDDWCGLGGLYVLSPSGAGSTEDWTASAGNPEDCVDELPVSFDDYISTDGMSTGTSHLFDIASLPGSSVSIGGVGVFATGQADASSSAKVKPILKSGSTQGDGSGVLMSVTPAWATVYFDQNPDDAADWEDADIDVLEIGVETE